MKAILEFDLPTDDSEFMAAREGMDRKIVIDDLLEWLRQLQKYENKETVTIDDVRHKVHELLGDSKLI